MHAETGRSPPSDFSFSMALMAMKSGDPVRRRAWHSRAFVVIMPRLELPPYNTQGTARKVNDRTAKWIGEDQPLDCQPYIAMYTPDRKWQPGWTPSQQDTLAEDWQIYVAPRPTVVTADLG